MIKQIMISIVIAMLANTFMVYAEEGDQPSPSAQSTNTSTDSEGSKAQGGFSPTVKPLTSEEAAQQDENEEDEDEDEEGKLMVREVC